MLLLFLLLVVVWLLSLLTQIVCCSVFFVFNLIIVSGEENLFLPYLLLKCVRFLGHWQYESQNFLIMVKSVKSRWRNFSGVVGNFGQLLPFCLLVINDFSKNDFSLSSSQGSSLSRVWMWARSSIITSDASFWEPLLFKSLLSLSVNSCLISLTIWILNALMLCDRIFHWCSLLFW